MWMDLKMLLQVWELWRENGLFKKEGSQDLLELKNPSWPRKSTKVNQQNSNVNLKKWHERWKVYKMKMVNEFLYYGDFLAASQIASFLVDFR